MLAIIVKDIEIFPCSFSLLSLPLRPRLTGNPFLAALARAWNDSKYDGANVHQWTCGGSNRDNRDFAFIEVSG